MSTSVASVVNHFPSAENGFTTTTSGSVSSGAATVGLNSVAGYANGEIAVFVIDPTDTDKKQTFTGTIDTAGVQVTDVVWTAGTNQTHALGATVVDYATATHISMMTKGIRVSLGQDGHISTTGVATFSSNIDVNDSSTAIRDSSDNELVKFSKTASAVNEITIKNAATGSGAEIQATGGDTNIGLKLTPKGTGVLQGKLNCMARAYCSTAQSITSGAPRKVTLDTEVFDVGANFDSTTNYRFVAPVSGYYQVNAAVTYTNITGGEQVIIFIYKDGAEVASTKCYVPNTNDDPGASISDLVYCAASSYIELYTQCTSTKSLANSSSSTQNYMSVHLVGV
jgi:hypothetical protein